MKWSRLLAAFSFLITVSPWLFAQTSAAEGDSVFDALAADDECMADDDSDCVLNAVQMRSHRATVSVATDNQVDSVSRHRNDQRELPTRPHGDGAAADSKSDVASRWPKEPPVLGRAAGHANILPSFMIEGHGTELMPYGLSCALSFAVLLLVWVVYNALVRWTQYSRFLLCQQKVQRVREAFLKQTNELPLCPYCCEFVKSKPTPSKVVFICGHTFHLECANSWFKETPERAGSCPICESSTRREPDSGTDSDTEQDETEKSSEDTHLQAGSFANEEVRAFILLSLQRMFPELVTDTLRKRWSTCHIEVWLSELVCPSFSSKQRPRCSSVCRKGHSDSALET